MESGQQREFLVYSKYFSSKIGLAKRALSQLLHDRQQKDGQ